MGTIAGAVIERIVILVQGHKTGCHTDDETIELTAPAQRNKGFAGGTRPAAVVATGADLDVEGALVVVVERREEKVGVGGTWIAAVGAVVDIDIETVLEVRLQGDTGGLPVAVITRFEPAHGAAAALAVYLEIAHLQGAVGGSGAMVCHIAIQLGIPAGRVLRIAVLAEKVVVVTPPVQTVRRGSAAQHADVVGKGLFKYVGPFPVGVNHLIALVLGRRGVDEDIAHLRGYGIETAIEDDIIIAGSLEFDQPLPAALEVETVRRFGVTDQQTTVVFVPAIVPHAEAAPIAHHRHPGGGSLPGRRARKEGCAVFFHRRIDPADAPGILIGPGSHGDEKIVEKELALGPYSDGGGPPQGLVSILGQIEVFHIMGDGHRILSARESFSSPCSKPRMWPTQKAMYSRPSGPSVLSRMMWS